MNGPALRNAEMEQAKKRKEEAMEARKATAKRAYEGSDATIKQIASMVRADDRTLKRRIAEGRWERKP